ncbi:MAG: hypothetical protein ACR2IF_14960 [Terriglobales bacterium]
MTVATRKKVTPILTQGSEKLKCVTRERGELRAGRAGWERGILTLSATVKIVPPDASLTAALAPDPLVLSGRFPSLRRRTAAKRYPENPAKRRNRGLKARPEADSIVNERNTCWFRFAARLWAKPK